MLALTLAACGGGGSSGPGGALPRTGAQDAGLSAGPYDAMVLSDGALEYYRLDETSGTAAADASGHGAAGTYVGTAGTDYHLAQLPGPIASDGTGWYQSSYNTNPHGVSVPGVASAGNSSSWTLEAWVKLSALPGSFGAIAGSSYLNRLLVTHAGTLLYQNAARVSLTSATVLQPGNLYHIVLRSDLSAGTYGVVSLSINGVKDANTVAYPSPANRQGMVSAYYWGQYDNSIYYKLNGYLGRVAYYATALSDSQIAAHYSAGLSAAPLPTPTPVPTPTLLPAPTTQPATPVPTSTPAPIGAPTGVSYFSAQIAEVDANQIWVQARPGCGYMHFAINSSTLYFNGPPKAGAWGVFAGVNKPCSISFLATTGSITPAAATSTSLSGVVAAQTAYGFTLDTGAAAPIPIVLASNTAIFGNALTVGSTVTVTGSGSTVSSVVATQVAVAAPTPDPNVPATPTPGPISVAHVMTAGYIYGYAGTPATVPLSSITPWITWGVTDSAHAAILRSAGVKVAAYNIWWRNHTTDNPITGYTDLAPGGAHAAAEVSDCSGAPIWDTAYGGGYEADPRSSAALGHAQLILNYRLQQFGKNYDAMFSDQTGAVGGMGAPCNYDQASYDAATNAVHAALGVPIIVNALGSFSNPASGVDLTNPSNVIGAMCELCYARNTTGSDTIETGTLWQNAENAEILMMSKQKIFWDYARLSGDPTTEIGLRTYAYASFLISYDPAYAMFQEALQSPSGFPVMPEVGLVPTQPLTTASSISGYVAPGGAYFREFGQCFYRGAFVSNCAVVINAGNAPVPVPSTSYSHSMVLSGGGVLDGGTISLTGPAATSLAPGTAAILFP